MEVSKLEKYLFEALKPEYQNGWIAKDKDGEVWVYSDKPTKAVLGWFCSHYNSEFVMMPEFPDNLFSTDPFAWLSWKDEEPRYIPDLMREECASNE